MKIGDIVLYSDGTYGEVIRYDSSHVLLRFNNGSQYCVRLGWSQEEANRRRIRREKEYLGQSWGKLGAKDKSPTKAPNSLANSFQLNLF